MGYSGRRHRCEWATTSIEQAKDYAQNRAGALWMVEVLPTAYVSWARGAGDMILDFESWLRQAAYNGDGRIIDQATLQDVNGDIHVFEQYAFHSPVGFVQQAARLYLQGREIREILIGRQSDLPTCLAGHVGEVWITGPTSKTPVL